VNAEHRNRLDLARRLADPGAPPVLTSAMLGRYLGGARRATISRTARALADSGLIVPAMRGLYYNGQARYERADILAHVLPGAVLSLNAVLQPAGVTRNPSMNLHAVLPWSTRGRYHTLNRNHRQLADGSRLYIYSLPEAMTGFGVDGRRHHLRATPERALCDWLYLAASGRSRVSPVPNDVDLDDLDADTLNDFAERMGVAGELKELRERLVDSADYKLGPGMI